MTKVSGLYSEKLFGQGMYERGWKERRAGLAEDARGYPGGIDLAVVEEARAALPAGEGPGGRGFGNCKHSLYTVRTVTTAPQPAPIPPQTLGQEGSYIPLPFLGPG